MAASARQLIHLSRRFFGALSDEPPDKADDEWARAFLLPGEAELWDRMTPADQRHSIEVATDVVTELGSQATRPVVAAALLHDVGKVVSDLGTFARAGATILWGVVPDDQAEPWLARRGLRRRVAQYRLHPQLGEALLIEAGSHELTSSWAADHHLSPEEWRVDQPIGQVLKACDDD